MATPRPTAPAPVLDISTLVVREQVRIDGTLYPLRARDELAYLTSRNIWAKFTRTGALFQRSRLSKSQRQERRRLLDECCRALLDAPPQVHAKLSDRHRMDIITVFSQLLLAKRTAAGAKATSNGRRARTTSSTGVRSSHV